jgi:hypothetical protein
MKGKFKVDGYFPIQKANHLFKDDMEGMSLLSFTSIKNKFNTTISVVFLFI